MYSTEALEVEVSEALRGCIGALVGGHLCRWVATVPHLVVHQSGSEGYLTSSVRSYKTFPQDREYD